MFHALKYTISGIILAHPDVLLQLSEFPRHLIIVLVYVLGLPQALHGLRAMAIKILAGFLPKKLDRVSEIP